MLSQKLTQDACLSCGACCAFYRVSFYWAEGEGLPSHMIEPLTAVYSCMSGTNQSQPRCVALEGEIGKKVSCSVYHHRSSTCQSVQVGDSQCLKARQSLGLISLLEVESELPANDQDYIQVS